MFKGTLVILSSAHWHMTWQRHHHIAKGMAELGYQVLFVEPIPKRIPSPREYGRLLSRVFGNSEGSGICRQSLAQGIEIISPTLLPDLGYLTFHLNKLFFLPSLLKKIRSTVKKCPLIMINYFPLQTASFILDSLEPDLTLYDCVADWHDHPFARRLQGNEKALLANTDLVLADSFHNFERMKQLHSSVHLMEGGVDYNRFERIRSSTRPSREKPLCVYFGDVGVHQDIDLMRKISHQCSLRLIGPVRASLHGFSKETEIKGPVSYEQIPAFLSDADVLILPYRKTEHNRTVLPAKTFECLASGLPTVVYGLESLKRYGNLFSVCDSHEAFLKKIKSVCLESEEEQGERLSFARSYDWPNKIGEIDSLIQQRLQKRTA